SRLDLTAINNAFDQDWIYWTTRAPEEILQQAIQGSFCLGLYNTNNSTQIGFVRLITDNTTFGYVTDLYVLPEYQGTGLGGWLIDCIDEYLEAKPYLRWTMLRTSQGKSREAYEKRLGMVVLESRAEESGPWMMGKKGKAFWG
ncbi:hypothetical protein D6D25_08192, partial [Aureobasidium pullulans]